LLSPHVTSTHNDDLESLRYIHWIESFHTSKVRVHNPADEKSVTSLRSVARHHFCVGSSRGLPSARPLSQVFCVHSPSVCACVSVSLSLSLSVSRTHSLTSEKYEWADGSSHTFSAHLCVQVDENTTVLRLARSHRHVQLQGSLHSGGLEGLQCTVRSGL
jgi:hypothetical protein